MQPRGAREGGSSPAAATDFSLPARPGPRPAATLSNPHVQLDQNAPRELQERLFARARTLPGVLVQPSMISVPGARAFVLSEEAAHGPAEAFMISREFAHLHPASDGSLHTMLPPDLARTVEQQGWGEQHPVARMGLIGLHEQGRRACRGRGASPCATDRMG